MTKALENFPEHIWICRVPAGEDEDGEPVFRMQEIDSRMASSRHLGAVKYIREDVAAGPCPARRKGIESLTVLRDLQRDFARARDWEQFHTPKNLAEALSVEASEIMNLFLWRKEGDPVPPEIKGELADVLIYLVRLADVTKIDLFEAAVEKIESNEIRFPAP